MAWNGVSVYFLIAARPGNRDAGNVGKGKTVISSKEIIHRSRGFQISLNPSA